MFRYYRYRVELFCRQRPLLAILLSVVLFITLMLGCSLPFVDEGLSVLLAERIITGLLDYGMYDAEIVIRCGPEGSIHVRQHE